MKRIILIAALLLGLSYASFARQPQRGYRGFVEWNGDLRRDANSYWVTTSSIATWYSTSFYSGVSTSHGYQISPLAFVGAGIGLEYSSADYNWIVPIFVQGRTDLKFGKFTPYADLRVGMNLAEGTGFYFSPTIGYRFNWGRKVGLNLGLGLTLSGYKMTHYEGYWNGPDDYLLYYAGERHHVRAFLAFRAGIDF